MNRTGRMLDIVLELQREGHQRAEDLAATIGISTATAIFAAAAASSALAVCLTMSCWAIRLGKRPFPPPNG